MSRNVKNGELVIVASLGGLKIFEAKPRTPEAEAGLKEEEVKLELLSEKEYVEGHQKLQDVVSDQAGRFKGGSQGSGSFTRGSIGEEHNLEEEIRKSILKGIAEDINEAAKNAKGKLFIALSEPIEKEVEAHLEASTKEKIAKVIKKDYIKVTKEDLLEKVNNA